MLRTHLVVSSIRNQGKDWRDAMLWLDELCAAAQKAGVAIVDMLIGAAALSSDEIPPDQVRMGRSTRNMLLDYAERYRARGTLTRP